MALTGGGNSVDAPKRKVTTKFVNTPTWTRSKSEGAALNTALPSTEMGAIITPLIGRFMVKGQLVYAGNPKPIRETKKTTENITNTVENEDGSTTTTTTRRDTYTTAVVGVAADIQILLCLGPDVQLKRIFIGSEVIWEGAAGFGRTILPKMPKSDNGLSEATVIFCGGSFTQAPDDAIVNPSSSMTGYTGPYAPGPEDYSGYPGMAYVVIQDFRADKYTDGLSFEVEREPIFRALNAGLRNDQGDVNTAAMIGEVLTAYWGFGGIALANIDYTPASSTFARAHAQLATENNYGSLVLGERGPLMDVIKTLAFQADAIIYHDPITNKIAMNLRRDQMQVDKKFAITDKMIDDITNFQGKGWNETIDGLDITYPNRALLYIDDHISTAPLMDVGIDGRGANIETLDLPYVPKTACANDIASRKVSEFFTPTYSFNVVTNRAPAYVFPGNVITVSHPPHGIFGARVIVEQVARDTDNTVDILVTQIGFQDSIVVKVDNENIPAPVPNTIKPVAKLPENLKVMDAPFFFNRARGMPADPYTALTDKVAFPIFLATPDDATQSAYSVYLTDDSGAQMVNKTPYPSWGTLTAAIAQTAGGENGELAEIRLTLGVGSNEDFVKSAIGQTSGDRFAFIGQEIFVYGSASRVGSEIILAGVRRAVVDTVPQAHSIGALIYITGNNFGFVSGRSVLVDGPTPTWRYKGHGPTGAPTQDGVNIVGGLFAPDARNISPPRPHDTRVDGLRVGLGYAVGGDIDVTWKVRYRKSDDVTLWTDATERGDYSATGPKYQTHRVFIIDDQNFVYDLGTTAGAFTPAAAKTVTVPLMFNGPAFLYVQAEFDGNKSIFKDIIPIGDITGGIEIGWNEGWNFAWNEAP